MYVYKIYSRTTNVSCCMYLYLMLSVVRVLYSTTLYTHQTCVYIYTYIERERETHVHVYYNNNIVYV